MLNYLLAWIVGLGSLGIFLSGFLFPEVRRKNDLIWAGLGLFYALILLVDAKRISGALLLGEMAGVALLVGLGWQAIAQRRQLAPPGEQTAIPDSFSTWVQLAKDGWDRLIEAYNEGTLWSFEGDRDAGEGSVVSKLKNVTSGLFKGGSGTETPSTSGSGAAISVEATTAIDEELDDWADEAAPASPSVETVPEPIPDQVKEDAASEAAVAESVFEVLTNPEPAVPPEVTEPEPFTEVMPPEEPQGGFAAEEVVTVEEIETAAPEPEPEEMASEVESEPAVEPDPMAAVSTFEAPTAPPAEPETNGAISDLPEPAPVEEPIAESVTVEDTPEVHEPAPQISEPLEADLEPPGVNEASTPLDIPEDGGNEAIAAQEEEVDVLEAGATPETAAEGGEWPPKEEDDYDPPT